MKTIQGHLTAHDKQAIQAILAAGLSSGRVGRKDYFLKHENGLYTVQIKQTDRGLIPCAGSALRVSTYTHKFKL